MVGPPLFSGRQKATSWETQAGRKPLEADWNHWPETCMLFGATCKCRVELLFLKKQWTWEVSNWEGVGWDCCRWKHTNVKKSRTSRNPTKSNHKIYECFAARHLACIIHLWQHGLQWSLFRTMCGCTKTPHRTTAKPTAGANHWVMEDQSRSTIHALGIDHGWQVNSDRCISIFHGNFPSPLQLQSSAFTSVDFPTQKLANQRCPLYTECYLVSWSTRLRYLLFLVILDTPDTSLIILPSTLRLISVVSTRGALDGYDDDASCAPPMVKTEGLMHQRHRPGLRSNLPSKTNERWDDMSKSWNLWGKKKKPFFTSKWIHGFHHNTFWMPKFIKVYQSLSASHPWFSSQPLLNIFDQPFTLESIWSALPNPVLKQGKTQSDWWPVTTFDNICSWYHFIHKRLTLFSL